MATFKMDAPPELTGDSEQDINRLYSYINDLYGQINYCINNLDEENMTDGFLRGTEE